RGEAPFNVAVNRFKRTKSDNLNCIPTIGCSFFYALLLKLDKSINNTRRNRLWGINILRGRVFHYIQSAMTLSLSFKCLSVKRILLKYVCKRMISQLLYVRTWCLYS